MPADLTQAREALAGAHQMVSDLCKRQGEPGWRRWVMSIPARPDYDPDLVIGAGLRAGDVLLARVDELEQARARDVAAIVGWLQDLAESGGDEVVSATMIVIADQINRGDWHDGALPADPRDARIAALEADKADALRELADATDALDITHADYPERFEDGTLARAIACEMHDYAAVMHGASRVYMHITGGKVSKPNTDPGVVIAMADDACTEAAQESREAGMVEQLAARDEEMSTARERIAALESASRAVLSLTGDETMEEQDKAMGQLAAMVAVPDAP